LVSGKIPTVRFAGGLLTTTVASILDHEVIAVDLA
jgi:hypothetical protein